MYENIEPYLEHVKGNTFCIVTGYARIPLYKLDRTHCILIDSGLHEDEKGIISCLEKEHLSVKAVLTSHSHIDHVGNHLALRRHFGARLYMSMFAAAANAEPVNLACCLPDFTSYRRLQPFMEGHFKPDVLMDWGADSIEVEGAVFQILHLPGHDAEHMGLVTPDNVAYLADAILSEPIVRALRTSYSTCVEPDLDSKLAVSQLSYDRYILAHNGVYDEIQNLALLNRDIQLEKLEMIESLADEYTTLEGLVAKTLRATGNDLSAVHKVSGTRHNVRVLVDYLADTGRLKTRAKDGYLEYIRKDLA